MKVGNWNIWVKEDTALINKGLLGIAVPYYGTLVEGSL